jgi:metal-dependent amidase/aminoacylase/carboxypeptidase family protein
VVQLIEYFQEAIIKLNVRTFDEGVRKNVLAAIERIANAEAAAAGALKPPEITPLDRYSLVMNDVDATTKGRSRVSSKLP